MAKYSNFAIIASFIGLWADSVSSERVQFWIGFSLIFTFGIVHGANDLTLIETISETEKNKHHWKLLFNYVLLVLMGAVFFYFFPMFALLLFVVVSGYHFGEQHWINKLHGNKSILALVFQVCYGVLILFLLFVFHIKEVQKIILDITSYNLPNRLFEIALYIAIVGLIITGVLLHRKFNDFVNGISVELFYLLVFAIIFKTSGLIWGFALYFVLWHSVPSIRDQILFLNGNVNQRTIILYIRQAIPYWIASLIGISGFYFLFKNQLLFTSLFFSFLASITFPHVLVVLRMFGKTVKKNQP